MSYRDRPLTQQELSDLHEIPTEVGRLAGRRVRAVRVVAIEGEGAAVARQLGQSLAAGQRVVGRGEITIDVYQHPLEDLGPYETQTQVHPLDAAGEAEVLAVLEHAAPESTVTARLRARAAARKAGV